MKIGASEAMASIFRWPARRHAGLAFPLLLGVSAAVHILSAFLFDIRYPDPVPPDRPAVAFQLAPPGTPLAAILAPNHVPDTENPGRKLLSVAARYRPGFETRAAELQPLPVSPAASLPLSHREPAPVRIPAPPDTRATRTDPPHSPAPPIPAGAPVFSRTLAARAPRGPAEAPGVPDAGTRLPPATFLTAVGPDGAVLYCFRQESSGDDTVDRAGEAWIRSHRFAPADETTWGLARCTWTGRNR